MAATPTARHPFVWGGTCSAVGAVPGQGGAFGTVCPSLSCGGCSPGAGRSQLPSAPGAASGGEQCDTVLAAGASSPLVDMSLYSDDINYIGNTPAASRSEITVQWHQPPARAPSSAPPPQRAPTDLGTAPARSSAAAASRRRRPRRHRLRAVDLCAGGGGASLGYTAAGFDVVAGVEIDKAKLAVFKLNHPDAAPLLEDVTNVDKLYDILSV